MDAQTVAGHGGSASILQADYWWYRVRADLLRTVLADHVGRPGRLLDVGSADGPSVDWLRGHARQHVALDVDPRGLGPGGVCGSATALPFADGTFDAVGAFDVVEHCDPEDLAMSELARVLRPGGTLMISVPAYQWAWSEFDDANGHHRRYTRARAVAACERAGLRVDRATYAFCAVFPFFAAQRVASRVSGALSRRTATTPADVVELPQVPALLDRVFTALGRVDRRLLARHDLPFGSSVVVVATKPRTTD
ncbi:class I SAM-dependent methyltransferase [Nocardioides dongkuii]|uniref:class I SAM-dependent methyltransferase n=1 Tax=Nocardioides dongkuii TaxID=2760089 RepID=UPI0015F8B89B|nr:class I SAM-dependent methyltransferase [Nocardioides dongkuii]